MCVCFVCVVSIGQASHSASAYIKNMVRKFRLTNASPVSTPMELGVQFSIDQCASTLNQMSRMHGVPYSEVIGSVLWPVVISQPDAAYAVGVLIQNLGPAHWEGVKNVSLTTLGAQKTFGLPSEEKNPSLRVSVMRTGPVKNIDTLY